MPLRPARRFTISDAMILVAAAAVGTLFVRSYMPGFARQIRGIGTRNPDPWGVVLAYYWISGPVSCYIVPLMAALVAMRLLPPRPRRLHLGRQPGFVAGIAMCASLLPGFLWYATIRHRPGLQGTGYFESAWSSVTHWTGYAVIGSWIALALARRFRPEPSWIDRMGRIMGSYWVLVALATFAVPWSQKLADLLSRGWPS